ncbi:hypothetical protein VUN84_03705 [Micrococcaceae bacterium Sec5.8]
MALNRTAVRTDIGYLTRRRKPVAQPGPEQLPAQSAATPPASGLTLGGRAPAAPSPSSTGLTPGASTPASTGLSLGGRTPAAPSPSPTGLTLGATPAPAPSTSRPATAATRPRGAASASERLFPAPEFGSLRELDAENPVVRLNSRQSAIGSLLVAGVRSVAWEDAQLTTGAHHAEGHLAGTAVRTPGNRPLAGVQDGAGIVSLRHVRLLRRALFIAGEAPLTVGVFDGAAAAVAARNPAGLRSVLYAVRVGAVLELRAEFVPADASDAAIWAMFGFTMTIPLDQRVHQR